jgi:polyribonucleotide nucleotidyltransferase
VVRIEEYGAFLEFGPGKDGLLHVSELDWKRVPSVAEHLKLGDELEVKIIEVDRDGRVRLSRKQLLPKPEGYSERAPSQRRPGHSDQGRGGGGGRGHRDRPRRNHHDD